MAVGSPLPRFGGGFQGAFRERNGSVGQFVLDAFGDAGGKAQERFCGNGPQSQTNPFHASHCALFRLLNAIPALLPGEQWNASRRESMQRTHRVAEMEPGVVLPADRHPAQLPGGQGRQAEDRKKTEEESGHAWTIARKPNAVFGVSGQLPTVCEVNPGSRRNPSWASREPAQASVVPAIYSYARSAGVPGSTGRDKKSWGGRAARRVRRRMLEKACHSPADYCGEVPLQRSERVCAVLGSSAI